MKLNEGKIRPGRVLAVVDEKGIIKATVPGLFSDQDDPDLLPPIYPYFIGNKNMFTKVKEDDAVWVMFFEDNPYELFYFRKDNIQESLSEILNKDYENIEVITHLDNDSGYVSLYYTDGTGWILRKEDSVIQIDKTGRIILDYNGDKHRQISIDDNSISLGTIGGSAEPAVLGDKLTDTLQKLYLTLKSIEEASKINPYTIAIGSAMKSPLSQYKNSIDKITSQHVTLD